MKKSGKALTAKFVLECGKIKEKKYSKNTPIRINLSPGH